MPRGARHERDRCALSTVCVYSADTVVESRSIFSHGESSEKAGVPTSAEKIPLRERSRPGPFFEMWAPLLLFRSGLHVRV